MMKRLLICLLTLLITNASPDEDNPYFMTFEELAQVTIIDSASLTRTSLAQTPSSVTVITREMIELSGARGLDELFAIYVPGLHYRYSPNNGAGFTLRGMSDTSLRYVILVNGRAMDGRSFTTGDVERHISTLGDIDRVEYTRGPGSALYGPGALSGVINIITLNGETFQGTEVSVKQGFYEDFSSFEFKTGYAFDSRSNIFLYYGLDYYQGSSADEAPLYQALNYGGVRAGERVDDGIGRYQEAYRGLPRHKLHLEYHVDDLEVWFRFTRTGLNSTELYTDEPRDSRSVTGVGHQQLTLHTNYHKDLTDELLWTLDLGYDSLGFVRDRPLRSPDRNIREGREDHYRIKNTLLWTCGDHQLALGNEIFRKKIGNDTLNNSDGNRGPQNTDDVFYTTDYSFFAEHQWQLSESWTSFVSGHVNKHTYTDYVLSPRLALVYDQGDWNAKFIYNSASRSNREFELRTIGLLGEEDSNPATTESYEAILTHHLSERLSLTFTLFYIDSEEPEFIPATGLYEMTKTIETLGAELELKYHDDNVEVLLSHSYSHLLNETPNTVSDHINDYAEHVSKLYMNYAWSKNLNHYMSLVVLWSFPGEEDFAYADAANGDHLGVPVTGEPDDDAFGASVFLNTGFKYNINQSLTGELNFHNILGWVDEKYNKEIMNNTSNYRTRAPAISMGVTYKF